MKMSNLWFVCVTLDGHWSNALKGFSGGVFLDPPLFGPSRCTVVDKDVRSGPGPAGPADGILTIPNNVCHGSMES